MEYNIYCGRVDDFEYTFDIDVLIIIGWFGFEYILLMMMMMMVNVPWDQNLVYRTLKKKNNLFVLKLYFYAQRAWREASQGDYNFDKLKG